MERENRKRGRDGDEKREPICNTKKQELSFVDDFDSFRKINSGRSLCNDLGVFDFPWLKEGVIFKEDECLGLEDTFGPSSYLNETPTTSTTDADRFFVQNTCQTPAFPKFREETFEDNLWNFQFDELDPLDCNWSSFDQPLDVSLNKV